MIVLIRRLFVLVVLPFLWGGESHAGVSFKTETSIPLSSSRMQYHGELSWTFDDLNLNNYLHLSSTIGPVRIEPISPTNGTSIVLFNRVIANPFYGDRTKTIYDYLTHLGLSLSGKHTQSFSGTKNRPLDFRLWVTGESGYSYAFYFSTEIPDLGTELCRISVNGSDRLELDFGDILDDGSGRGNRTINSMLNLRCSTATYIRLELASGGIRMNNPSHKTEVLFNGASYVRVLSEADINLQSTLSWEEKTPGSHVGDIMGSGTIIMYAN